MEKIISDLKNKADKVVKKSGDFVEMSKIKLGIAGVKSEIGTQFKALGELVYGAQKKAGSFDTEQIDEVIAKLDELFERLNELNEGVASLKKEKVCKECGKRNPLSQAFCGGCGSKFSEEEEPAQEGEVLDDVTEVETV